MKDLREIVRVHGDTLNLKVGNEFVDYDHLGRRRSWKVTQVNTATIVFETLINGWNNPWSVAIQIPFVDPIGNATFAGLQAFNETNAANAADYDQEPYDGDPPLEDDIEAMFDENSKYVPRNWVEM